MANAASPILRPLGLDPTQGYDTASAGAKDAQVQANKLSDLQWNRQMQGLGQAQGYTNQLQSLYNSIYSPGGGAPAAGGMPAGGMPQGGQGGSSMLLGAPPPPSQPAGGNGSTSLSGWLQQLPSVKAIKAVDPAVGAGLSTLKTGAQDLWGGIKSLF